MVKTPPPIYNSGYLSDVMHPQATFEETLPKKQGNASDDVM